MTDLTILTGDWTIDASHSSLGFVTRHAMITKVRGHFADFEGTAQINAADLSTSQVTVTTQMDSFSTGNAQRDGHVKTGDFLDIEKYPTMTFVSTKITQTGDATADITGDLTIKDVTKSVTIPFEFTGTATDPYGNLRAGFEGTATINRNDWGITFNAALETGGVLISEKVALEIEISAIKNS